MFRQSMFQQSMFQQFVSYSQYNLRKKIATYFQQIGKPSPLGLGHCHGLSILWLRRMAEGREHEFYADVATIVNCSDDQLHEINHIIEGFFKKADKRQNPQNYSKQNGLVQGDIDKLIKATKRTVLDKAYLDRQLGEMFDIHRQNGNMFYICHKDSYWINDRLSRHAIAVYVRNGGFFCYDANYPSGKAKFFSTTAQLVYEIKKCLFTSFELKIPTRLSLNVTKIESSDLIVKQKQAASEGIFASLRNTASHYSQYLPWAGGLFSQPSTNSKKRTIEQAGELQHNGSQSKKRKTSHS